jgi:hypothetical protein
MAHLFFYSFFRVQFLHIYGLNCIFLQSKQILFFSNITTILVLSLSLIRRTTGIMNLSRL